MTADEYTPQCEELHSYLIEKLGHKWRLDTWRDKYRARIRKYGLEACKRAVDGFCAPPGNWYMREQAHNAPKLIFRSDKALESFLAKAPEPSPEVPEKNAKVLDQIVIRATLESRPELNARLHTKLEPLKDVINEQSYKTWIKPLLFWRMEGDTAVLWHETGNWVQEHYREHIAKALGCPVKIVDEVKL